MINTTISALSLASILGNSPLFSASSASLLLTRSLFTQSFAPVFFGRRLYSSAIVYTKFTNFLATALVVSSYDVTNSTISDRQQYSENNLTIIKTHFINCTSTRKYGGAIYYESENIDSTLVLDKVVFQNCTSQDYGGAIYLTSATFTILSSCFQDCFVHGTSGNAIHEFTSSLATINGTTIVHSSILDESKASECVFQNNAISISQSNFSIISSSLVISTDFPVISSFTIFNQVSADNYFQKIALKHKDNSHMNNCDFINISADSLFYFENVDYMFTSCAFLQVPSVLYKEKNSSITFENSFIDDNINITDIKSGLLFTDRVSLNINESISTDQCWGKNNIYDPNMKFSVSPATAGFVVLVVVVMAIYLSMKNYLKNAPDPNLYVSSDSSEWDEKEDLKDILNHVPTDDKDDKDVSLLPE